MNVMIQDRIVDVLLRATPEPALDPLLDSRLQRALAVHRNTVRHALIEALCEAFPAVRVAVGEDYFRALAVAFIAQSPPRSPVLQDYGDGFAGFVDGFPPLSEWPWLADLARIDWARREAYHAADAEPMTVSQLLAQAPEALLAMHFELHPSLRLLASPYPLTSLWFAHQAHADDDDDAADTIDVVWNPEACRIWRVDERVRVEPVDANELAVLRALSEGRNLLLALWQGFDGTIDQERIVHLLQRLIEDRMIVRMRAPADHTLIPE